MHIPKRYGQSRIERCPFCSQAATARNKQQVPVCRHHRDNSLGEMRCLCGSSLEMREGKWGIFFSCFKCGNMDLRKVLEFNAVDSDKIKESKVKREKTQDYTFFSEEDKQGNSLKIGHLFGNAAKPQEKPLQKSVQKEVR